MTNFTHTIYETPYTWGETCYISDDKIESFVRKLNRELDWDCEASECSRWRFVVKFGNLALYKMSARLDVYALFTKPGGQYEMAWHKAYIGNGKVWAQWSRERMSEEEARTKAAEFIADSKQYGK